MAFHLNPHLLGLTALRPKWIWGHLFDRQSLGDNVELSDLAVVGAVGDLQHVREGRLRSVNRLILDEAEKNAVVRAEKDLQAFGDKRDPFISSSNMRPALLSQE